MSDVLHGWENLVSFLLLLILLACFRLKNQRHLYNQPARSSDSLGVAWFVAVMIIWIIYTDIWVPLNQHRQVIQRRCRDICYVVSRLALISLTFRLMSLADWIQTYRDAYETDASGLAYPFASEEILVLLPRRIILVGLDGIEAVASYVLERLWNWLAEPIT